MILQKALRLLADEPWYAHHLSNSLVARYTDEKKPYVNGRVKERAMSNSRHKRATEAIRQVALRKGISTREVYREMERAIEAALLNPDPQIQRFWRALTKPGSKPTPEDLILYTMEHLSDPPLF